MAEIVYQNLEGMLAELEDMQQKGIFDSKELTVIIKKRTDFEYKLQKRIVEKEDILNYLEYELKLNQLRKKREKKLKVKKFSTSSIAGTKRVHSLFQKALLKFGGDLKLWMQYVEFCQQTHSLQSINEAFGKLLQTHGDLPEVWLTVAKYNFESSGNIENARTIMLKGLRLHKNSKCLWHEYFKLELLHVEKIKARQSLLGIQGIKLKKENESEPKMLDDFLLNKTAIIVYRNAIKQIPNDIDFRISFLNICFSLHDVEEVENEIMASLTDDYQDDEKVLALSATRELISLRRKDKEKLMDEEYLLKVEKACEAKFENILNQKNTPLMWELYVYHFMKSLSECKSPKQAERYYGKVMNIFKKAEAEDRLNESMIIAWSDLLEYIGNREDQMHCLQIGVEKFVHSTVLVKKFLILKAQVSSNWHEVNKSVDSFMLKHGHDLTFWQICSELMQLFPSKKDHIKEFIEKIMQAPSNVKNNLIPKYLNELYVSSGIKSVRKIYRKLITRSKSLEILNTCIELECSELSGTRVDIIRNLYEKAIEDYGKENIEIWISYIQFEKNQFTVDFQKITLLFSKAKKIISEFHLADFLKKYTLIMSS